MRYTLPLLSVCLCLTAGLPAAELQHVIIDDFQTNEHQWEAIGDGVVVTSAEGGRLVAQLLPGDEARRLAPLSPEPLEPFARLCVKAFVSGEALGTRIRVGALGSGLRRVRPTWYFSHDIPLARGGSNTITLRPTELVNAETRRLITGQSVTQFALYLMPPADCHLIIEELSADVYTEPLALERAGPRALGALVAARPAPDEDLPGRLARARAYSWTELTASTITEYLGVLRAGDAEFSPLAGYELLQFLSEEHLLRSDQAATVWSELSGRYPDAPCTAAAAFRFGSRLAEQGLADAARLMAEHLVAHAPDPVWEGRGRAILADLHAGANEIAAALQARRRAALLSPALRRSSPEWLLALAQRLTSSGRVERVAEAEQVYSELAEQFPSERERAAKGLLVAGEAYLKLEAWERARLLFRRLQQDCGTFTSIAAGAQARLAKSYWLEGRSDQAVAAYAEVLRLYPRETWWVVEALYEAGVCLQESGDLKGAIGWFRRLVDNYPDRSKARLARLGLARCYHRLGGRRNARLAIRELDELLQRWPESEEAAEARRLKQQLASGSAPR